MLRKRLYYLFYFFLFFIISCEGNYDYLNKKKGETIFYEVIFINKEKKKNIYRQSYSFLPRNKNLLPAIKSNGEIIVFSQDENGITRTNLKGNSIEINDKKNKSSKVILAFPVTEGTKWSSEDKTTLQMKLGYDRVYDTNLEFTAESVIEKTNDVVSINNKKIEDCIKITSYGKTSFDPGPPLSNIKIEVTSVTWYSKNLGIVKYKREEKSDSETMGTILYEKTMIFDS